MPVRPFGRLADGSEIAAVDIAGGGLSASIITWGAVLRDLRLDGHAHPLVCGFDTLPPYLEHSPHMGAIAGRVANRIGDGRFMLDGREIQVDRNVAGRHHLHGGTAAFGKRPWRLAAHSADSVTLALTSPDGDGGYPGRVEAECVYRIEAPATLTITLTATTDAPTLVNLAGHSYFNLDGAADVLGHRLRIAADRITETDADHIPTGRTLPVAGTPHDFRAMRPVLMQGASGRMLYDDNWCLSDAPADTPRFAARLEAPAGGIAMELLTTEPGLQLYDGSKVNVPVPGLDGRRYGAACGLCLEAQRWPDAPNHPGFPSAVLRPGETYRQVTQYRFAAIG